MHVRVQTTALAGPAAQIAQRRRFRAALGLLDDLDGRRPAVFGGVAQRGGPGARQPGAGHRRRQAAGEARIGEEGNPGEGRGAAEEVGEDHGVGQKGT